MWHNSYSFRQKPKKVRAAQVAHFWDAFSTIFSPTRHCLNTTSSVHSVTLISIQRSCVGQSCSKACPGTLEYFSCHNINGTIHNHPWGVWFQVTCSAAIPSFPSGHTTDWLAPRLAVPPRRRPSLVYNRTLLCGRFIPWSSLWAEAETGLPSTQRAIE